MIGLKTPFRDGLLRHIAKDVLKLAKDGLERRSYKEARFLREVAEVVNSGELKLGKLLDSPPPGLDEAIAISKYAFGSAPSWLLWIRYNTFLILYPPGITSEDGMIFIALAYIKASEKYFIRIPNKWNFSFDYFYAAIIALGNYVPRSPHMYTYMLGQRKKDLSKAKME
ncbi:very-long-chain (3R)-3-hydroxyacyl-CoA dehydratase PASTICCINO 2A-like [Asparagus officinalis]|uniref:very-long-chain (3R)-3-hydroxyacyl-CoA dehydratase PASTICCINO 2A-like n=1 Tax=Asparagus officinalis TaxID=4686 RepID=UPI00098E15D3|nr:very-long-chain (3R)-3-hydroxyacyl-CoA dehydratase PASTICCINO 2A-like [Asparagus officinalis]